MSFYFCLIPVANVKHIPAMKNQRPLHSPRLTPKVLGRRTSSPTVCDSFNGDSSRFHNFVIFLGLNASWEEEGGGTFPWGFYIKLLTVPRC